MTLLNKYDVIILNSQGLRKQTNKQNKQTKKMRIDLFGESFLFFSFTMRSKENMPTRPDKK